MCVDSNLSNCISTLVTLGVAIFVAAVQRRQAKTAKEKLRLDLYNKRFAIYENALNFFQQLEKYEPSKKDEFSVVHLAFIKAMRESKFLFHPNSGVYQILEKMHMDSGYVTGFRDQYSEYEQMTRTAERLVVEELRTQSINILLAFSTRIDELEAKIGPYLKFQKINA